ncbi:hypothetical protein [Solicola sp. PLA-1-18]|uniref:hypothetical protein n=1 Tax=Solicola sp. PLA-1-18 TaxID=3380532 RepID=UPI003B822AE8
MIEVFAYSVAVVALLVGLAAGWLMVRDHRVNNPLFYAAAALEVLLLALLVTGCVALSRTDRDVDGVTFVSYLVTVAVIPPAAILWGIAEKSRWGTGVVVVGMITVAALCARLTDIWTGTYV